MALLFYSNNDDAGDWLDAMAKELPDQDFRIWPDEVGEVADIDYALVGAPGMDGLKDFPNLKAIFSLGAGVNHLAGRDLPEGVPVVRLRDPGLTGGMSEYVAYWVLHYHRHFGDYAGITAEKRWQHLPQTDPGARRVGIMGLGVMGADAVAKLKPFGFDVCGWSRGKKAIEGVEAFHGKDGLGDFLKQTEILVCLLPLTPETTGIINADTLSRLPRGAVLINAARGGHVVDEDLIAALDGGRLAAATLDVFHTEPLPEDHPFWAHPKITVTPHMASLTVPASAAKAVAENIRRMEKGGKPEPIVDLERGY